MFSHACQRCDRRFAFAEDLKNHIIKFHTSERLHCNLCGKTFSCMSTLRKHQKSVHQKLRAFACSQCDKRFYSSFELNRHMLMHTGMCFNVTFGQIDFICSNSILNPYYDILQDKNHTRVMNAAKSLNNRMICWNIELWFIIKLLVNRAIKIIQHLPHEKSTKVSHTLMNWTSAAASEELVAIVEIILFYLFRVRSFKVCYSLLK